MADKTSSDDAEKPWDRVKKNLSRDPVVGMFARHRTGFILPFLVFAAGLFILYLGSIDCQGGWSKCLISTDKSYVAAFVGFFAASIGLTSWLASFYEEFDRKRFDLFNSLHKEFRTEKYFNNAFEAIVKMEENVVKGQDAPVSGR